MLRCFLSFSRRLWCVLFHYVSYIIGNPIQYQGTNCLVTRSSPVVDWHDNDTGLRLGTIVRLSLLMMMKKECTFRYFCTFPTTKTQSKPKETHHKRNANNNKQDCCWFLIYQWPIHIIPNRNDAHTQTKNRIPALEWRVMDHSWVRKGNFWISKCAPSDGIRIRSSSGRQKTEFAIGRGTAIMTSQWNAWHWHDMLSPCFVLIPCTTICTVWYFYVSFGWNESSEWRTNEGTTPVRKEPSQHGIVHQSYILSTFCSLKPKENCPRPSELPPP